MRSTTLTAFLFAALGAALALLQAPSDSDMFWHLSSGEWTLDHGAVLDRDIWSFTRAGTTYDIGAWLGDVIMVLAYRAGGWIGLDVLRAALVGVAAFFTARITLRVQPHAGWAAPVVIAAILVSRMVWGDRPQLFTLALFPVVLDVLMSWRFEDRARRLVLLPVVFVLWANLHGAFAIGLAAVAIFVIDVLLEGPAAKRRQGLAVLVACVVASQINPIAAGAITKAASYAAVLPSWIVEDLALDVLSGAGFVFALLFLLAIGAAMLAGRDGIVERLGAPLLWPGLIGPFSILALAIQRETPYACMVLAPFVAAMIPHVLRRRPVEPLRVPRAAALAVCAVILALLGVEAALAAPSEPDLTTYPSGALEPLRGAKGNLLNEYDWGGYLIRYAPEHPTFVDGRGGAVFPRAVVQDFQRAAALAPGYRDVLARWDIGLALLRPERPLAGALREDGWRVLGSGTRWVLLARP